MEKGKKIVTLQSIFDNPEWQNSNARLPLALGKDINDNVVVPDLTQLSHLLIAGATGSGNSVCINSIILGLLKKYSPAELNLPFRCLLSKLHYPSCQKVGDSFTECLTF